MREIVIANIMRAKNKQSFFALHQIQSKIHSLYPDVKVEFHIMWDTTNELKFLEEEKWKKLMDSEIKNLHSYDSEFFNSYVRDIYNLDYVEKFILWKPIYHILIAHYLRRVKLKPYYLIYDDDILINDDFKYICDLLLSQTPVMITEPMNMNCDKVLFDKLLTIFGGVFQEYYLKNNPNLFGFNAGFQGIDLSIYDNFLSRDRFKLILDLFDYKSIYDKDGNEIWGNERFIIDTQQQSFFGLMGTVFSKKPIHILNPEEYYVVPNFGVHPTKGPINSEDEYQGWGLGLQSKITHFIGHTLGKGKPKQFLDRVDEYLKIYNFL